ncbi:MULTISPECIES: DUF1918 domain-containing protein [Cryobacterium]|uniref:DUF1918 domain-containing protein n=1 Tax=Cryobacterium glucosi TaxID=1259175 RepID=A0ABY2IJ16_9MICO|nr:MULTISPECIES: DUF1918 domain-containing protein [Cryobacterium]MDY7529415.1 DUF1918 domain-containing protein [Cryobacterium sp. 10C2]MDY7558435.1 DUF1918 domain-containing protein [Cryobacterium sp. 10C3]MEB0001700.1 DUF1918 domain-containing protein [Cryobacterium sp. RTC2.1]MEB0201675.1 DUF1918 domain-containing protein [Cryobacterium sp. 5I3]MEB0286733.1 DUF1918 domain-containing protein [Cryobacterium sp. 10S3]
MHAIIGDRIIIRGRTVETPDKHGEIIEVRGPDGEPPYLVRFGEGHQSVVYPGTDFVVERSDTD